MQEIFSVYDGLRNNLLADLTNAEIAMLHGMVDKMLRRLDEPSDDSVRIDDPHPVDRLRD